MAFKTAVLVLVCATLSNSQCDHDHDHGAHGHIDHDQMGGRAKAPEGPARPTTNAADVPPGPYKSACKGCKLNTATATVDCESCKSSVFESNYEALTTSTDCADTITYTFDGEAGKLACASACPQIKLGGKSWLSGKYKIDTGDWAKGIDGSPVYSKPSGKSFLFLFKQGVTWRVGRKPGSQSAIAVLNEGETLLTEAAEWSLYSSKSKTWVPDKTATGTCV